MVLTAAATLRIKADIAEQRQLKKECKWLISSFNRPNLKYMKLPKRNDDATITEIKELIEQEFPTASGIIYCLS